jgi:preprotein translocase subunit SecY
MTVVSPRLKALQEEGDLGRRKITQYTRYLTVVLCSVQSFGIAYWLQNQVTASGSLVRNPGVGFIAMDYAHACNRNHIHNVAGRANN